MSDAEKRDAIISARRLGKTAYGIRLVEEIARLHAENTALRAAVERVLALHEVFGDWCDRCNCVAPCSTLRALEGTP